MQNLFQTRVGVNQIPQQNQNTNTQQENNINLNDFNTMQQMFATNAANVMKVNAQQNQTSMILGDSTSNNVNASDFSTMQYLFATNNLQNNLNSNNIQ